LLEEGSKKVKRFAIIGDYDRGHRYIKSHSILRLLPIKWAENMIAKTKVRITDTIYDNNEKELGYIIDVPGFFIHGDKLIDLDQRRIMINLVHVLEKNHIQTLVFPLWRKFISPEEKSYLEDNSIVLLDGSWIRLVSLVDVVERLLGILKSKLVQMEIGIWGADNSIGQLWAEVLAPFLNYLVIGGNDIKALERLSNKILYETGLSCQITTDPDPCLANKHMIILSSTPDGWYNFNGNRIIIFSCSLSHEYFIIQETIQEKAFSGILIESGWPSLNQVLNSSNTLKPWDKIGILEANLFIKDKSYQDVLMNYPLNKMSIKKIKEILRTHGINCKAIVSNNKILTYDGFRKVYFRNCLDNRI
jgi:hypothetical protein